MRHALDLEDCLPLDDQIRDKRANVNATIQERVRPLALKLEADVRKFDAKRREVARSSREGCRSF